MFGIFVYGTSRALLPIQGGVLCVQPPVARAYPSVNTGSQACAGVIPLDFNEVVLADPNINPGDTVDVQLLTFDLFDLTPTLGNALELTILP